LFKLFHLQHAKFFETLMPDFRNIKISIFPGIVFRVGSCNFFYSSPFGKNTVGALVCRYTDVSRTSDGYHCLILSENIISTDLRMDTSCLYETLASNYESTYASQARSIAFFHSNENLKSYQHESKSELLCGYKSVPINPLSLCSHSSLIALAHVVQSYR
jgi:hypothetical protein